MRKISYARHRFPPSIIQRAVWLYFRFPLSFRDVEEMLAERGIDVSYETIRRWVLKFGPAIAANVRSRRVRPSGTWHLDEVFVRIGGKRTYLWRAVDDEGEVLEVLAQSRRNKRAALKLMRKLLKKQGYIPDKIVTDKLGSYSAALRELGLSHIHVTGGRPNNRRKFRTLCPAVVCLQTMRGGQRVGENDDWDGSNHPDQCSDFCLSTMPSTINSICSAI
jgi:putative transposase